ncbi:hypothetical protein, partial [Stutzerimonas nitrititolerans]|uniref:hypothetical protein n=1 Tax=Stutzerimonas nitrititolerans TaxID=2482751 RepID=UPI0028AC32A5
DDALDRGEQDRRQEQELIRVLLRKNAAEAAFFRWDRRPSGIRQCRQRAEPPWTGSVEIIQTCCKVDCA